MLYVYIGCLTFSIAYAVLSAILGGDGHGHGGVDVGGLHDGGFDGVDGGDIDGHDAVQSSDVPSPFSPLVLASAIATFGAVGIIGKLGFKMSDLASLLVSLGFAGSIGAAIFFGIVKFMYGSQSNSVYSQADLVGIDAEVITPIPENGIGEIAYVINGVRYNISAKSAYGGELPRGAAVRIKDVSGNIAYVVQKMSIYDYELLERDKFKSEDLKKNNNVKGDA